jgi:phenylpyruvate tautomerase PptA (4-oxalocrotonate tautomerase family)
MAPIVRVVPVIEIRSLRAGVAMTDVLAAVTREVAAVLGEEPGGTWATWEEIPAGRYAEAGEAPRSQPRSTHPPLVRVTAFEGKSPELVARLLETVAAVLARELGLEPGNVFVRYEEATSGRLFTGGTVVTAP